MTVAELIRELQAMPPGATVHVVASCVFLSQTEGDPEIQPDETYVTSDVAVQRMGPWCMVVGK
jgi:hypothetical protein